MAATFVYLIRHGESVSSRKKEYCGLTDTELTKKGITQAKTLARRLKDVPFKAIYSSTLRRAYQTAEIINKPHCLKVRKLESLNEMNFGVWESMSHEEIMEKFGGLYSHWLENLDRVGIPGGEGLKKMRKRVDRTFSRLLKKYRGEVVALVSHSGPIRIILSAVLKLKSEDFFKIRVLPGAINIIEYQGNSFKVKGERLPTRQSRKRKINEQDYLYRRRGPQR